MHMGFSSEGGTDKLAALLHDAGKIGAPENIFSKSGSLSAYEMWGIKKCPVIGQKRSST
jgi:HD-GYP domain-containing protein (c-di-GMP phosphodiesterase class II)